MDSHGTGADGYGVCAGEVWPLPAGIHFDEARSANNFFRLFAVARNGADFPERGGMRVVAGEVSPLAQRAAKRRQITWQCVRAWRNHGRVACSPRVGDELLFDFDAPRFSGKSG